MKVIAFMRYPHVGEIKVAYTNLWVKEMRVEAPLGTHIRRALEEALGLARQIEGKVILEWSKFVDISVERWDNVEELLRAFENFLSTGKITAKIQRKYIERR